MVKRYRKGYIAENKLIHELAGLGYMVVRSPHSGSSGLPSPDIIAAKDGRLIVIECKAREDGFKIENEQLQQLIQWQNVAGAEAYICWRISRKGWKFMHLRDVVENGGNIGKKFAEENGFGIEGIY